MLYYMIVEFFNKYFMRKCGFVKFGKKIVFVGSVVLELCWGNSFMVFKNVGVVVFFEVSVLFCEMFLILVDILIVRLFKNG